MNEVQLYILRIILVLIMIPLALLTSSVTIETLLALVMGLIIPTKTPETV